MKKYLFISLVLFSFSCDKKVENKKEEFVVAEDTITVSYADSVEIALVKTKNIDVEIKNKITEVKVLSSENKELKVELKSTKDSLVSTQQRLEVLKTSIKVPKKKSFFQKLVGAKTDSVEVEKIDTIKVN
jgi:hypothetical protein